MSEHLTITKGEDRTFVVMAVKDGLPFDATGVKVYMTVKRQWKDVAPVLVKRTANAGGSDTQILVWNPQTDDNKGRIEIYIEAADTESLDPDKNYVMDVWMVTTTNKRQPIVSIRDFKILPRVSVVP